jgi:transposase
MTKSEERHEAIRQARLENPGLSQREIARMVGCSRSQVYRVLSETVFTTVELVPTAADRLIAKATREGGISMNDYYKAVYGGAK